MTTENEQTETISSMVKLPEFGASGYDSPPLGEDGFFRILTWPQFGGSAGYVKERSPNQPRLSWLQAPDDQVINRMVFGNMVPYLGRGANSTSNRYMTRDTSLSGLLSYRVVSSCWNGSKCEATKQHQTLVLVPCPFCQLTFL